MVARLDGGTLEHRGDWRSVAGEWLLWFALAADRPTYGRFPVRRWWFVPCRAGWLPPGKGLLRGFGAGFLAAVDDDLLGLGCGVASPDYWRSSIDTQGAGQQPKCA